MDYQDNRLNTEFQNTYDFAIHLSIYGLHGNRAPLDEQHDFTVECVAVFDL